MHPMAVYGPNGDAAFLASARERQQRAQSLGQASIAWIGWLVAAPLAVVGILGDSAILWIPGLLGLAALTAWALHQRAERRRWQRMARRLAEQTALQHSSARPRH